MIEEFEESFDKALRSGQGVIPVVIHSQGGDLFDALHMVSVMKTAKVPVATIVAGHAYSAAALLFSAGTEGYRFMAAHASIMLHDVGIEEVSGKCNDIEIEAEELRRTNRMAYRIMAMHTGNDDDFFYTRVREIRGGDLYIDAAKALEWNFTNVIDLPQLTTQVRIVLKLGQAVIGSSPAHALPLAGEGPASPTKKRKLDPDLILDEFLESS